MAAALQALNCLNLPFPGAIPFALEKFSTQNTYTSLPPQSNPPIITMVLGITFGIVGAVLSWNTSTCLGVSTGLKIFYSVVAYIFSWLYVIIWLIFYRNACEKKS